MLLKLLKDENFIIETFENSFEKIYGFEKQNSPIKNKDELISIHSEKDKKILEQKILSLKAKGKK